MKKSDFLISSILLILALFIWLRDLTWASTAQDTLPILAALPFLYWFGQPWEFREEELPIPIRWILVTITFFLFGIAINSTLTLALGWTSLLWGWLSVRLKEEMVSQRMKLMILPLMAFPWVTLDADRLGWFFRISGAWTTAQIFSLIGYPVNLDGSHLLIGELPVNIEAACAGMNTLQSMLIAGSMVAYIYLENSTRFWWNLPLLVLIAWLANTARIVILTSTALVVNPEFAMGSFHTWGGWLVLILMFGLSWILFSLQSKGGVK